MRGRGAALAATLALACAGPAQLRYEEELARTPPAAAHAVHGERLAELMRGLGRLRTQRLPQALDVETEREARAELVAQVALEMAASAERIPDAANEATLDPDERRAFRRRADELRRRALLLAQRAEERPPVDLGPEVTSLEATCDACHAELRDGGPRDGE